MRSSVRPSVPALLLPFLLLVTYACGSDRERPGPGHDSDTGQGPDELPVQGSAIDESTPRELASTLAPPSAFYHGLDVLGLTVDDLSWTDGGATFRSDHTRLHWVDQVRHQGDLGPVLAGMAAGDVRLAVAADDGERLPELLSAAYGYLDRDEFVSRHYDEPVTALDDEDPLLAALEAAYTHAPVEGGTPMEAPWEDVRDAVASQIQTLPEESRLPLAFAIEALLRTAELRDASLLGKGEYDMDAWAALFDTFQRGSTSYLVNSTDFENAHDAFDFERLGTAVQFLARSVERLRLSLADIPAQEGSVLDLDVPFGRIYVSFEDTDDAYDTDAWLLLVDRAGNDTFEGRIATNASIEEPVSVVLDLEGNDAWRNSGAWTSGEASVPPSAMRMQGFGLFGLALLDDASGDDTYQSSGLAQGAGVFGAGVLVDHAGDDVYSSYYGGQGHAQLGMGLLFDEGSGADSYETLEMGQGYGGPRGIGWLVDDGGNDTYLAIEDPLIFDWAGEGSNWSGSQGFGFGVRDGWFTSGAPILSGGLGGLFDLQGDDSYQCAVMCQGFGYFFGAGIFYDGGEGNDDHLVTHKYAMGGATHYAIGLLVDEGGSDTYRNDDDDECIGLGYDCSVAWHLDLGDGDDVYTLDNYDDFVVGVSRIPALGVLVNESGNDVYSLPGTAQNALGRSITDEGVRDDYLPTELNIAFFMDLAGDDTYPAARKDIGNGLEWVQTEGGGADWTPLYDFGYGLDQ
jgi:hypothetical protein